MGQSEYCIAAEQTGKHTQLWKLWSCTADSRVQLCDRLTAMQQYDGYVNHFNYVVACIFQKKGSGGCGVMRYMSMICFCLFDCLIGWLGFFHYFVPPTS